MTIGLSTYAFFWQWHQSNPAPLDLAAMVDRTADLGAGLFQICDYPLIESFDGAALTALRRHAARRGVALELGTRGVTPAHLARYLDLAKALDVTLVRSMIPASERDRAVDLLRESVPGYAQAGVTLALETYEQVPTPLLVDIVAAVGSPALGICLDPANCVAALEHPADTIRRAAPWVRNIHVKDFAFTRADGWVGFQLTGCPLGEGLLDYAYLMATVDPAGRGINQVIEHWLPWQGDSPGTCALENRWTAANLNTLRSWNT
ncbi:sugar phosphate isomerase/epimerase family protein [Acrocarpospora catenulata]|uniref:sugar phosphate isomerase/epimerase family protein n=1 Tax=Acrocarpospora catenulata TaxID=2836182 RepID=UPI001BD986AB|nr:sugar phosphate isomerase/epimerase family protein [Acrocarpospora catenulata]